MHYLIVALPMLLGGITQGLTGFGSGIVAMLFLPSMMVLQKASALMQVTSTILNISMVYTYRKHINLKLCIKPWLFYFPIYYLFLSLSADINADFLKPVLGLFLVAIAIYCFFFSDRIHIKGSFLSAGICAGISGAGDAVFSIGGPPMVLYILSTTREKEEYLGTLSAYFMIAGVIGSCLRVYKGQITWETIPYLCVSVVAILIGKFIGGLGVKRVNQVMLKKIVYVAVGISGFLTFLVNLSAWF